MRGDKLIIEGQQYTTLTINKIPHDYTPAATCECHNDDKILFLGKESILSNFHVAPFQVGLSDYEHNEMYIQKCKAEHYGQEELAIKICMEKDPAICKRLGGRVKCDKKDWHQVAGKIAYTGALAKFSQNAHLLKGLLNTGNKTLAEATRDTWWGIGKTMSDPTAFEDWSGENIMGNILMKVRDELKPAK